MTTEQLAKAEMELCSKVLELYEKEQSEKLESIFATYKEIHKRYSDLAKEQDEALKRGLFIQWYSITEPNFLTGINEIDEKAEENIIDIIEEKIQEKSLDNELKWMLNYYANWEFVFERFKNRQGLAELISNRKDIPNNLIIDKIEMNKRGQMGKYWNSLNHLS